MGIFDLNNAVSDWTRQLKNHQGLEPGHVEELEGNLWDRIDDLLEEGKSEKDAFDIASQKVLSSISELANELYQVHAKKPSKTPPWERTASFFSKMPSSMKIAFRHMKKRKAYAFMNILGLSVSICFSFLIWIYVQDQSSYDQHYENADRIYRVIFDVKHDGVKVPQADIGQPVGPLLKAYYPEVSEKTRLRRIGATNTLAYGEVSIKSSDIFVTDEDFFKVFSAKLIHGKKENALTEPNTVVLTETMAQTLFGRTNVVGEFLTYSGVMPPIQVKVTAVIKDLGNQTHLPMKALISYSTYFDARELNNWLRKSYTYVLLSEANDIASLENQMPLFIEHYMIEELRRRVSPDVKVNLLFQKLTDIYLADEYMGEPYPHGNKANLNILVTIMFFLLIMAAINYVNMATATALERAKEVSIRKVLGSNKKELVFKFMSESILLALFAAAVSLVFVAFLLPYFGELTGLNTQLGVIFSLSNLKLIFSIGLTLGLLAGLYPSVYLARLESKNGIKSSLKRTKRGSWLRKGLIVFEYTIAATLMIWILVVGKQIDFMKTRELGYDKSRLLELKLPDNQSAMAQVAAFLQEVEMLPQVDDALKNAADLASGYGVGSHLMKSPTGEQVNVNLAAISTGYGFAETIGSNYLHGRDFNKNDLEEKGVLINETAMNMYGWGQNPLKAKWLQRDRQGEVTEEWNVVGVVRDFKMGISYDDVSPMIIFLDDRNIPENRVIVNFDRSQLTATVTALSNLWAEHFPDNIFQYELLEDRLDRLYAKEEIFQKLLSTLNIVTVLITILGVIGLISFTTEVKRKEIAIRKVNGAQVESILRLLSNQFLILLIAAFIVAGPIGYFLSKNWLNEYAMHVDLSYSIFVLTFIICLGFTLLAVVYQALKAANANPVLALRDE